MTERPGIVYALSMPQTSVATTPDAGIPGQIAESAWGEPLSLLNEEESAEIAFGLLLKRGTADGTCKLLSATSDTPVGLSVHSHGYAAGVEVGDTGVKPAFMLGVMSKGSAFVFVEDAVTEEGDEVHVRAVASDGQPAGSFRATVDGNHLTVADDTFTAAATNICTATAHGLLTGDGPVQLTTTDTLPAGLDLLTDYWIIKLTNDTFSFAASLALALAGTAVDITDTGTGTHTLSDKAFTFTAATTDICTAVDHGRVTGDGPHRLTNSGGALPAGLATGTDYWIIRLDDDTFKLATSFDNAIAGTAVDVTGTGTGTHTLTGGTERIATINCSSFAKWKKGASARGIAIIQLDCVNAALATAG